MNMAVETPTPKYCHVRIDQGAHTGVYLLNQHLYTVKSSYQSGELFHNSSQGLTLGL